MTLRASLQRNAPLVWLLGTVLALLVAWLGPADPGNAVRALAVGMILMGIGLAMGLDHLDQRTGGW